MKYDVSIPVSLAEELMAAANADTGKGCDTRELEAYCISMLRKALELRALRLAGVVSHVDL